MTNSTLYIGPDGRLERGPSPKGASRKGEKKASKARQLTERLTWEELKAKTAHLNHLFEPTEAERRVKLPREAERTPDTWEFMHDAILGGLSGGAQQLSDRIFCPQCRSQCDAEADLIEVDGHLWGDCWQCGFRGPLSKFNLY